MPAALKGTTESRHVVPSNVRKAPIKAPSQETAADAEDDAGALGVSAEALAALRNDYDDRTHSLRHAPPQRAGTGAATARPSMRRRKSSIRRCDKAAAAFARIDADGNGSLNEEEFKAVCLKGFENGSAAGRVVAEKDAGRLFALLDEDMSGDIEVKELKHALRHSPEAMALASHFDALHEFVESATMKNRKEEFKQLFKGLDADGSGALDFDELKAVCLGAHDSPAEATEENLRKLFDLCDEDHGGTIDCHELRHVLKKDPAARTVAAHFPALTHLVELAAARAGKAKHKKKRKMTAALKRKLSKQKTSRALMSRFKGAVESVEAAGRMGGAKGKRKRKGVKRRPTLQHASGAPRGRRATTHTPPTLERVAEQQGRDLGQASGPKIAVYEASAGLEQAKKIRDEIGGYKPAEEAAARARANIGKLKAAARLIMMQKRLASSGGAAASNEDNA